MNKFKVEKNVPIPNRTSGRPSPYPWLKMKVGDSFHVSIKETSQGNIARLQRNLSNVATYAGRKHNLKFTTHMDDDEGGVRVWRVE